MNAAASYIVLGIVGDTAKEALLEHLRGELDPRLKLSKEGVYFVSVGTLEDIRRALRMEGDGPCPS